MKGFLVGAVAILSLAFIMSNADVQGGDKAKITIKQVMKEVSPKDGLCKKCGEGKITVEERARLVVLMEALAASTPPKGDAESWKTKTDALLTAAKAANADESKAKDFAKLYNCAACHKEHRPAAKK